MIEWRSFLETFIIGLVGVAVFSFTGIPLPWLIGSLVTVATWSIITRRRLYWPLSFRQAAMILLGYLIGTSFTKETIIEMGEHIPSMIAVTALTIGFSLLLGYLFSRVTGLDLSSCLMGSIPGGLSQIMVLMDELKGVNPTVITFMQTMRVMVVVIAVPILTVFIFPANQGKLIEAVTDSPGWLDMPWYAFLLYPLIMATGVWLFVRLNIPTAYLLGPMVFTIVLTLSGFTTPPLPGSFVELSQILIGVHIGLQMNPRDLPGWKKTTSLTFGMIIVLVLFGFVLGYGLTSIYDLKLSTALLSTAPGGMVEMGLTAVAVGGDVSVVTSYQLFRLLIVLFFVPLFFKWLINRKRTRRMDT
ncbi:AbrB family transcriptional regulator [Virgibacillus kekensis]|uniref:AbrB family transcriptional regulator n=1 Tax=Virgibacillus kekensis TaxID=202261 RepID=A0ABV9DI41_9BACI